ncbi:MAG: hypothetical protein ACODAA_03925 [Gemmatimonadota bacterium]
MKTIAGALGTLATLAAAVAAFHAADASKTSAGTAERSTDASERHSQALVFGQFMQEYASKKMRDALLTLTLTSVPVLARDWAEEYVQLRSDVRKIPSDSEIIARDLARRRAKYFYLRAAWMLKEGAISKDQAAHICNLDAREIVRTSLTWMEDALAHPERADFRDHMKPLTDRGLITLPEPHPDSLPSERGESAS